MDKSMIGWCLAGASVLALAGCAPPRPDPRGVDRGEVLLQVSASGQADTRPDEARFAVGVTSAGATAQAATDANSTKMNTVIDALKALGVPEADIQTRQLSVAKQEWGLNKGRFEANNVVEVHLRAVDKASAAIAAATQAGANVMWGPNLTVADPEKASRGAYAAAYKAARTRADAYAEAAGLKVARILTIRDGGGIMPPQPMQIYDQAFAREMAAAPPAPPVMAGTTTQQARVSVEFALVPK
jgi:uncharacterized protein YggE